MLGATNLKGQHMLNENAPNTAIQTALEKFTTGDPAMFDYLAPNINFAIEHYGEADADISWQRATNKEDLAGLVGRLGTEVFPQGTKPLALNTVRLGNGWHLTRFEQEFFYGVRDCMVQSTTYVMSHEQDGLVDYFRETVTTVDTI